MLYIRFASKGFDIISVRVSFGFGFSSASQLALPVFLLFFLPVAVQYKIHPFQPRFEVGVSVVKRLCFILQCQFFIVIGLGVKSSQKKIPPASRRLQNSSVLIAPLSRLSIVVVISVLAHKYFRMRNVRYIEKTTHCDQFALVFLLVELRDVLRVALIEFPLMVDFQKCFFPFQCVKALPSQEMCRVCSTSTITTTITVSTTSMLLQVFYYMLLANKLRSVQGLLQCCICKYPFRNLCC